MRVRTIIKRCYKKYLSRKFKMNVDLIADSFFNEYKEYPFFKTVKIHRRGFTVLDWNILGLDSKNYKQYLSNVQYCKMHPFNGEFSKWIDDKLTLKYLCSGTKLDKYMPEYYFQIDVKGNIIPLVDYKTDKKVVCAEEVLQLLEEKTELAIKLVAGAIGAGFYKAEYVNGKYLLNGTGVSKSDFVKKISELRNYLIMEYLHPHDEIAKFCPNTVNSIRYLLGRNGAEIQMLCGFIRFGTESSGFVENYNAGGVLCYINKNGEIKEGNLFDKEKQKNIIIAKHPDSKRNLIGTIPMWGEIVEVAKEFSYHFPQLNYMGMDFVVTSQNRVKMLEVNSLTSLDTLQLHDSILNSSSGEFYKSRMK